MNRHTIPLGRILGIPLDLDPSWFLAFVMLTWTLAVSYYPAEFTNWPVAEYWLVGAVTAVLMFGCVVLHELSHSAVALRYKIPVRSITLFVFGGVSNIAAEPPSAAAEFWIAIAGPAVSFVLAVIFFALAVILGALQFASAPAAPLLALAEYLAYINGSLALFNLIPGFPLDGGRVLRAILWGTTHSLQRATLIAANVGRGIAYLFILGGAWQVLAGNVADGLWIAFIGWFLADAAAAQLRQQTVQDVLAGHGVSQAMDHNYAEVGADTSLQALVDDYILSGGQRTFVVERAGQVEGLLTLSCIKEIPRAQWPAFTAAQAMTPIARVKQVRPDTDLWQALEVMDRDGVNQLPVIDGGRMRGMLSRADVISYLRTMREIGGRLPSPVR